MWLNSHHFHDHAVWSPARKHEAQVASGSHQSSFIFRQKHRHRNITDLWLLSHNILKFLFDISTVRAAAESCWGPGTAGAPACMRTLQGEEKKRGSLLVCYSSLNYGSLLQPIPALPQTPKLHDCSKQSGKKSSLSSETLQRCFVVGLEPFQQINTCLLKARFSTKRQRWRGFCSSWIKGCFTSF